MPQKCKVCTHQKQDTIERLIAKGIPLRSLSNQYGMSAGSLSRHKRVCMASTIEEVTELVKEEDRRRALDVLAEVTNLYERGNTALSSAENNEDLTNTFRGIRTQAHVLKLFAELTGEIDSNTEINILMNPQFIQVQAVIMQALNPFPEARQAVVKALEEAIPANE